MNLRCKCGGWLRPRLTKVAVSAAGHAMVAITAAMNPRDLQRAHITAMKTSQIAGSALVCHDCGRDASFGDLLG